MKVGGDVGFLHMRTQQNPKKIEWYRKMCTTCAPNESDHWLRLLVGSSSLSPLARPYSFSFPPSLPEKKFVVLVWDDTTTDTKLGLLKHAGGVHSTEVIVCITWTDCLWTQTGSWHCCLGNGHCIWIGNDAKCVSHWRRGTYVSVLGNMDSACLFVDDVWNMQLWSHTWKTCDRRRYWWTPPPKKWIFRYLVV